MAFIAQDVTNVTGQATSSSRASRFELLQGETKALFLSTVWYDGFTIGPLRNRQKIGHCEITWNDFGSGKKLRSTKITPSDESEVLALLPGQNFLLHGKRATLKKTSTWNVILPNVIPYWQRMDAIKDLP